ncbi:Mor transcription activator family protein [Paenibacillus tyrfis]|uniref:Mor transcription activator domain-containing protein n=1 Tax=Paenibacillus tyrfis TaxID=1501230 RepID=A0A081NY94_9BACL|nr:Mor transcription activator family protein [Paenibacillus tyrfis]KEQ23417.1 hypothetical protein ET33_16425 [Paenibacillus tyrfis]
MSLTDDIIAEIDPTQLPHPYYQLAEAIGLKPTLVLAEQFGGTGVYFPKLEAAIRAARDRMIRREFDGGNYKELARRYRLSESWVREIVDKADENQISIFDVLPGDSG